jgi:desumoylating isopeptidase 1
MIDMGETSLDQETFDEYLAEIRQHYTAEKVCLLFTCSIRD